MQDYQSNSHKDKTGLGRPKNAQKEEPLDKVVSGEVVQKPKGPGRKFKEVFLGGDAQNAGRFVILDVLLPALRNLAVDMVTRGTERLVYGENSRRGSYPGRTNYQSYGDRGGSRYSVSGPMQGRGVMDMMASRMPPDPRQNRHQMNDVIIESKEEADLVVERMMDVLEKYDVVSLGDLYELLGLPTSHVDNKWGWTFLSGIQVRQIRQGYLLELPPLEPLQ